ncbi:unnamed protein product, partial [Laminaria digitata]
ESTFFFVSVSYHIISFRSRFSFDIHHYYFILMCVCLLSVLSLPSEHCWTYRNIIRLIFRFMYRGRITYHIELDIVRIKIDNQQNQIHQGCEVAPVLRLEFIYSYTARRSIADSEDPTPDYRSGGRKKNTER